MTPWRFWLMVHHFWVLITRACAFYVRYIVLEVTRNWAANSQTIIIVCTSSKSTERQGTMTQVCTLPGSGGWGILWTKHLFPMWSLFIVQIVKLTVKWFLCPNKTWIWNSHGFFLQTSSKNFVLWFSELELVFWLTDIKNNGPFDFPIGVILHKG